jgi:hypothetical protein
LARRDAHPRAHGCVKAEFQVEAALPVELAQGVFVRGTTYPAWVRFSNGSPDPSQPDAKGDIRGMAVKLLNVPGDKILPHERALSARDDGAATGGQSRPCDKISTMSDNRSPVVCIGASDQAPITAAWRASRWFGTGQQRRSRRRGVQS